MKLYKKRGKLVLVVNNVVYVVLEMPSVHEGETKVHGVFAVREDAEQKALKLKTRHHASGYIAVLKQRVLG